MHYRARNTDGEFVLFSCFLHFPHFHIGLLLGKGIYTILQRPRIHPSTRGSLADIFFLSILKSGLKNIRKSGMESELWKVCYGTWVMESKLWKVSYGKWVMGSKLWKVSYGSELWKVSYGKWVMESELWKVSYGKWVMESKLWKVSYGK